MADRPTSGRTCLRVDLEVGLSLNLEVGFDRPTLRVTLDLEIHHQLHRHLSTTLDHQIHQLGLAVDIHGDNNRSGPKVVLQPRSPRLSLQTDTNLEHSQYQNPVIRDTRSPALKNLSILPLTSLAVVENDNQLNLPSHSPAVGMAHLESRAIHTTPVTFQPITPLSIITMGDEVFDYIKSLPSPNLADVGADSETCHICLEPLKLVKLLCGHHFGAECIEKWLTPTEITHKNTCPICRAILFDPDHPGTPRRIKEIARLLDLGAQDLADSQFNIDLMNIAREDTEMRFTLGDVSERYSDETEEWSLGTVEALRENHAIEVRFRQIRARHRATIENLEVADASNVA